MAKPLFKYVTKRTTEITITKTIKKETHITRKKGYCYCGSNLVYRETTFWSGKVCSETNKSMKRCKSK